MRAFTRLALLLGGLLVLAIPDACLAQYGEGKARDFRSRAAMPIIQRGEAAHPDAAMAESLAIEEAREKVRQELNERYGENNWVLSPEELRRYGLLRIKDIKPDIKSIDGEELLGKEAEIELNAMFLQKILEQARQERKEDRQLLLVRILAGLVVFLLSVASYLRLEEATRGYYTWLLRLGVGTIMISTVAGLYLWR